MQDNVDLWLELERREEGGPDYVPGYVRALFDKQRAVFNDPAKRKTQLTTRRAGKTTTFSAWHTDGMERFPGADEWSGYLTLTKGQSKRNLEGELRQLVANWKLPVSFSEPDGQFTLTHANGHRLWIGGVDDLRKAERYRGNKWRRFGIDEAGAWPSDVLKYVIDDVIGPGLTDRDGELLLGGTPGVMPVGYFWEVTTPGTVRADGQPKMPQWSTHHWSLIDNPFHPWGRYGREYGLKCLDVYRKSRGWEWSNPTLQREYMGLWVVDEDSLIYRYDAQKNHFDAGMWPGCIDAVMRAWGTDLHWVLGTDVGQRDATTFELTVSRYGYPHVLYLRSWGGSEMITTQRAAEVLRVRSELEKRGQRLNRTVMDPGGGGAMLAGDMQRIYNIAVEAAAKKDKAAGIRLLQGGIQAGHILFNAVETQPLLGEMSVLPWNDDRTNHHESYPDDHTDAAVYARRAHPILEKWEHTPITPGTPQAINHEAQVYKHQVSEVAKIMQSDMNPSRRRREIARMGFRTGRRM